MADKRSAPSARTSIGCSTRRRRPTSRRASCRSSSPAPRNAQIREVPVSKILPNPAQPRLSYDEESLTELAASIREHGVLQPILVRPSGSKFELIAGERRWRASGMAERETIPGDRRRVRRADRARGQHHREPPARGCLAARGSDDVPQDDRHVRLLGPAACAEGRQGQGLRRESASPDRCARRRPRAACPCAKTRSAMPTS